MDVIKEFSAENVKYLELRTTPKSVLRNGMTKQNYVEAVIKGYCFIFLTKLGPNFLYFKQ